MKELIETTGSGSLGFIDGIFSLLSDTALGTFLLFAVTVIVLIISVKVVKAIINMFT